MKNNTPAFQFYPQDFLVGCAMLSAEETGAYIRLLCYQWTSGGLPDNDDQLARLGGCSSNAVASIRDKFCICQDSKLRNSRLEQVRDQQNEYRASQKKKAEKRWKTEKTDAAEYAVALQEDQSGICPTDALQSSTSIDKLLSKDNNFPVVEKAKKKKKEVDDAWLADLKRHYRTVDVDAELRQMDVWLAEHPQRQKTRLFIIRWLNRTNNTIAPAPEKKPVECEWTWD